LLLITYFFICLELLNAIESILEAQSCFQTKLFTSKKH
jgi:hypothetical protein